MANTSIAQPECRKCGKGMQGISFKPQPELTDHQYVEIRLEQGEPFTLLLVCMNKNCEHFNLLKVFCSEHKPTDDSGEQK